MSYLINIVSTLVNTTKNIEKKTQNQINEIKKDIYDNNRNKININKSQSIPSLNSIKNK